MRPIDVHNNYKDHEMYKKCRTNVYRAWHMALNNVSFNVNDIVVLRSGEINYCDKKNEIEELKID
jgi:hypothetical protein